jgi:uncharacterized membrane protein (UPF0136 family)
MSASTSGKTTGIIIFSQEEANRSVLQENKGFRIEVIKPTFLLLAVILHWLKVMKKVPVILIIIIIIIILYFPEIQGYCNW